MAHPRFSPDDLYDHRPVRIPLSENVNKPEGVDELRAYLNDAVSEHRRGALVILYAGDTKYLSEEALEVLVEAGKRASHLAMQLFIQNPQPDVQKKIARMKIDYLLMDAEAGMGQAA